VLDPEALRLCANDGRRAYKEGTIETRTVAEVGGTTFQRGRIHHPELGKGLTSPQIKDIPSLIQFLGYDPEPPNPITIAEHLWATRRLQGLSQRQAAQHLGVKPSTWSDWECGKTIMKSEHRSVVARFTGLDADEVHLSMKKQWNKRHSKSG
jgi:hypothetical protein